MRRRAALAGSLLVAIALSACSGSSDAAKEPTAQERLTTAQTQFDAAKSVEFTMASADVPPKQSGVSAAEGSGVISATEPKFDGKVTGTFLGMTGTVDLRAIGDKAWMKVFNSSFQPFDLKDAGSPNPAIFFEPSKGLSALLGQTKDPVMGTTIRAGGEILRQVSGTLPPQRIEELFHLGDGTGTFTVTYGLTDSGELRTINTTGPFYKDATSTYRITLTNYGAPVEISAP